MLKIIANGKEFFFDDIVRGDNPISGKAIVKGKSKVRTLAAVDVEAVENMKAFIETTVTESRLEQGLDNLVREQLLPFEMKSLGDFIRWVYNDIVKEEQDSIIFNQIDVKKLGSAVANVARPWYIQRYNAT